MSPSREHRALIPASKLVYDVLAHHQESENGWDLKDLLSWLQTWKERFIFEFKLQVSEIALCVDWLHWRCLGHFRRGHNGFGLVGEIAINRRYLQQLDPWEHLGTLLHELLHAWQEVHGTPATRNYHNVQFRRKAARYGLIIDECGHQQYEPESAFFELLSKYEVEFPTVPEPERRVCSKAKLKKWSCNCNPPVNVRVAIADFHAKCLRCQTVFVRAKSIET